MRLGWESVVLPENVDDFDALDELIDALVAAGEGDRTLDMQIEYCLGVALGDRIDIAGVLIKEGISWETVSQTLDARVPEYTSSLDAAVKGENIEFAVKSVKRERWGAMHRSKHRQEFLAWAATEPLARRLAALKGRRADMLIDRERARQQSIDAEPAQNRESSPELIEPRVEDDRKARQRMQSREPPLELTNSLPEEDDEADELDWKVLF